MAEFNTCAGLINNKEDLAKVDAMLSKGDLLQQIIDLQHSLQVEISKKLPVRNMNPEQIKTKGELVDWVDRQMDCLTDEFRELKNAIGGMSNGEKAASAVWKSWKANNVAMRAEFLEDMSKEDMLELRFEVIDMMHFFVNILLATGLTDAKDVFRLYMLKNLENIDRQNRSY